MTTEAFRPPAQAGESARAHTSSLREKPCGNLRDTPHDTPHDTPCDMLYDLLCDNHGRRLDYLRLAVTDRCNLRCRYCMPEAGLPLDDHASVLSWEEMLRLCAVLARLGVRKLRVTGGEPLVRKGVIDFLKALGRLPERPEVLLTTNGTRLAAQLEDLHDAGLRRLNVSLDSLRRERYQSIARRDRLEDVLAALAAADAAGFALKINVVVLPGWNDDEIVDFVALTRERRWIVRFIEPMPFGGDPEFADQHLTRLSGDEILTTIRERYPLEAVSNVPTAVDRLFQVPGFAGQVGVIYGMSRSFCGSCSRLRVSAQGQLRTCLYAAPSLDLRGMLRAGASDEQITTAIIGAARQRHRDGFAAEAEQRALATQHSDGRECMARIGG